MTNEIIIILIEAIGRGLYRVFSPDGLERHCAAELVARTREPLLASARVLLDAGVDPRTVLAMARKATPDHVDMWGRLGTLAGLTVHESATDGPSFRRWQPSPLDKRSSPSFVPSEAVASVLSTPSTQPSGRVPTPEYRP
jgi:hypothetical protein